MEPHENVPNCQIICLPRLSTGKASVPPESLSRKVRLIIRRGLNVNQVRSFKLKSGRLINNFLKWIGKTEEVAADVVETSSIKAGDLVNVRSLQEIQATLNPWQQLKGCMWMPEMIPYCETTQRVFKRVERFMDEREYRMKKTRGVILLEGLHCEGTSDYGRCDRSCFYFWREEWLEKVEESLK